MAEINIQDSQVSVIPETQPDEEQLDNEIATIRAQIKSLTDRRSILTASLLTSPSTQPLLAHAHAFPSQPSPSPLSTLRSLSLSQTNHTLHRLHRLISSSTTFSVRDPDPHALSSSPLLGIRIEAFTHDKKSLPPYYLLLSRPYSENPSVLRVHRHTIPPCIPLAALVAKWLPAPRVAGVGAVELEKAERKQNLPRLVRELRREIAGFHMRKGAVERLREGLVKEAGTTGVGDVKATDAEIRDVRIEWRDWAVGRVRIGKDGRVEKAVVLGEGGRAREMERKLLGGDGRVEGLAERLREVEGLL